MSVGGGIGSVFLSYTRADEELADGIARTLRAEGIEVEDGKNIPVGQSILTVVSKRIQAADAIVLLISSESRSSEWLQTEAALAVGSMLSDQEKIVLPVTLGRVQDLPFDLQGFRALVLAERSTSPQEAGRRIYSTLAEMQPDPERLKNLTEAARLQGASLNRARLEIELEQHRSELETTTIVQNLVLFAGALVLVVFFAFLLMLFGLSASEAATIAAYGLISGVGGFGLGIVTRKFMRRRGKVPKDDLAE